MFWGLSVEMYSGDENYMYLCCKNWKLSPLGTLTFYQGYLWMDLFGDEVYCLRILSKLSQLVTVGIGCAFLYKRGADKTMTLVIALLSLLITFLSNNQLYGWDGAAYAPEALFTVLLMLYLQKPTLKRILALGFACGLMVCYRLPLAVGAGILIMGIIVGKESSGYPFSQKIKDIFAALLSMIATWLMLGVFMCGSFSELINSFDPQNYGSILRLLIPASDRVIGLVPGIMFSAAIAFIAFFMAALLSKFQKIPWWIIALCNVFIMLLALSVLCYYLNASILLIAGLGWPIFMCTIALLPLKNILYKNNNVPTDKISREIKTQLIFVLFCFFLPVIGSDTWFERFSICGFFPIAIGIIWPLMTKREVRIYKILSALLMPSLIVMAVLQTCYYQQEGSVEEVEMWGRKTGTTSKREAMNQIVPLVRDLMESESSFTFFGSAERFVFINAFESIQNNTQLRYPLNNFYVTDEVDEDVDKLANTDVIIFPNNKIALYPNIVKYLSAKYGYIFYKYSDCVDVLYHPRDNLNLIFCDGKTKERN